MLLLYLIFLLRYFIMSYFILLLSLRYVIGAHPPECGTVFQIPKRRGTWNFNLVMLNIRND